MKAKIKSIILNLLYPGWGRLKAVKEGYTVVIVAPMDMPFLTYLALRGLNETDLTNCNEILVVPDATGSDGGSSIVAAIDASKMNNVRFIPVSKRNRLAVSLFSDTGVIHWAAILEAIKAANTDLIYLHDVDAFFLEPALIQSHYEACRTGDIKTLGVTARWDPFFINQDIKLPGTWELMFSSAWAKKWSPVEHLAATRNISDKKMFFDTMLYPQYMEYNSGGILVKESNSFVHIAGTIVTYRKFNEYSNRPVGDELFRLLFLSMLKSLSPDLNSRCQLPSLDYLCSGLTNCNQKVHYCFPGAAQNYWEFKQTIDNLLNAPLFNSSRQKIIQTLAPFDEHFSKVSDDDEQQKQSKLRVHGLWLDSCES